MSALFLLLDVVDSLAELWLVNRSTTRADRRYARSLHRYL